MTVNKVTLKIDPAVIHYPGNMKSKLGQCEQRSYNMKENAVTNLKIIQGIPSS
jgi:hypothetical protein